MIRTPETTMCPSRENRIGRQIARIIGGLAILLLLASGAGARSKNKDKTTGPKKDPLAEYVTRVSGPAASAVAPTTAGSLWIDNGRLANMVADYKASRVGDLVTISVSQNLSSTNTGNVATNRSFSASSGITALAGHIKTSGCRACFRRTPRKR